MSESVDLTWVVAAAIVDDLQEPHRLLAARRTEPEWAAGHWELPGGTRETHESPVEALHRELDEELGVRVRLGEELPGPEPQGLPGWPIRPGYRLRVWWAELTGGDEPAPLAEHDAITWLDRGSWLDAHWLPSNEPVVSALADLAHATGTP